MMKIVTNQKGLYAMRWGIWPFRMYFDLRHPGFWWSKSSRFYPDCFAEKDKVQYWFGILNPKVAVVILDINDKQMVKDGMDKR